MIENILNVDMHTLNSWFDNSFYYSFSFLLMIIFVVVSKNEFEQINNIFPDCT